MLGLGIGARIFLAAENLGVQRRYLHVLNATTGFLTAKGTEAGTMLSSILANVSNLGLQGVMNETEKTTVKVTRTVKEHIMTGMQLSEVNKLIAQQAASGGGSRSSCRRAAPTRSASAFPKKRNCARLDCRKAPCRSRPPGIGAPRYARCCPGRGS